MKTRILNSAGSGLISRSKSNDAIRQAFKIWSDITPLVFEEKTEGFADIYLKFGAGYHGDQYPFDGFSGTLAHAYPPMSGFGDLDGDVHFDDAEPYTDGTPDGEFYYFEIDNTFSRSMWLSQELLCKTWAWLFIFEYISHYQYGCEQNELCIWNRFTI